MAKSSSSRERCLTNEELIRLLSNRIGVSLRIKILSRYVNKHLERCEICRNRFRLMKAAVSSVLILPDEMMTDCVSITVLSGDGESMQKVVDGANRAMSDTEHTQNPFTNMLGSFDSPFSLAIPFVRAAGPGVRLFKLIMLLGDVLDSLGMEPMDFDPFNECEMTDPDGCISDEYIFRKIDRIAPFVGRDGVIEHIVGLDQPEMCDGVKRIVTYFCIRQVHERNMIERMHDNGNCLSARELYQYATYRTPDEKEMERIGAHLKECTECSTVLEQGLADAETMKQEIAAGQTANN